MGDGVVTIYYVTSSDDKWRELARLVGRHCPKTMLARLRLLRAPGSYDIKEIQSPFVDEVARRKCADARVLLRGRLAAPARRDAWVLVDDTGLALDCLGGLPGAYAKDFVASLGPSGVGALCARLGERGATAQCVLACQRLWGRRPPPVGVASGECGGAIARQPHGDAGFGWDAIFRPTARRAATPPLVGRPRSASDSAAIERRRFRPLRTELATVRNRAAAPTFAEMTDDEKDRVSHRGAAVAALVAGSGGPFGRLRGMVRAIRAGCV